MPTRVIDDQVQRRHQHQEQRGGREDAERQADRHRDQEPRLHAGLEQHRRETEERGQRGQQDRTEAPPAAELDGVDRAEPEAAVAVDRDDQDQRVVDHHARQRDDPDHAHHAHVVPHDDVAEDRADDAERDREHHDDRLDVAAEGDRQQGEDDHQRHDHAGIERRHRLVFRLRFTAELVGEPGILGL